MEGILEWIFAGGAAGARAGAAGIWAYIPPKWPETGGRGPGLPGKVKIGPNRIKTNSFKGIRGRIVQGKRVEIDIEMSTWLETRVRSLFLSNDPTNRDARA